MNKRQPRDNRQERDSSRPERPKVEWTREEGFTLGSMVAEITSRPGRDGKLYSCTVSRADKREGKEFFSRFWRPPQDLRDVIELCRTMLTWYECDDAEQKQQNQEGAQDVRS